MAGQDALWTRVVAADSPAPDDAILGHTGSQEFGNEQFVQEFSSEDRTKLMSDQANLNALSVERGRQYFAVCEQVCYMLPVHDNQWVLYGLLSNGLTTSVAGSTSLYLRFRVWV